MQLSYISQGRSGYKFINSVVGFIAGLSSQCIVLPILIHPESIKNYHICVSVKDAEQHASFIFYGVNYDDDGNNI